MYNISLLEQVALRKTLSRVHDKLIIFQDAFDSISKLLPTRSNKFHDLGNEAYNLRQEVANILKELEPKE